LHITYLNTKVNFPIFSNISRNCKLGTARLGSMYSFHRFRSIDANKMSKKCKLLWSMDLFLLGIWQKRFSKLDLLSDEENFLEIFCEEDTSFFWII
ncbi:hypothetical protein T03_2324, partial [Trichinella britovi]